MTTKLSLHPDRFFTPEPAVRKIARELYDTVKSLPILSPHGHVDPNLFADNRPFPDPTALILIPDHYIYRMLYSQGIKLESLGIPRLDGAAVERDHEKIWQLFADHFYLFAGTPTGVWLNHELVTVFSVEEKLTGESGRRIYRQIQEKLAMPEFLPRPLFDAFGIEVLNTTDAATDTLAPHQKIKDSGWSGRIIPCFRPDAVINLTGKGWGDQVRQLSNMSGIDIRSFKDFIHALENRRVFFKSMGAVSTDQGIFSPYCEELPPANIDAIFQRALQGAANEDDAARFTAHMLMEMARMSCEDGLVMQLHPGSFRNHNQSIFQTFGADKGCDIPVRTEYTHNLRALLNKYGNEDRLSLVVFTLDESTYARELAPLAGHYPCMKLGASWWFHDSIEGMTRFRQMVTETAGIYNTVGFTDDTRAFPSIPARHALSRRIDANFLAGLVSRHIIDMDDAFKMSRALAYELAKKTYHL